MNVEVFVHGVPNGESFWGKDEDRNYFGNFYDQTCSDKVKFLVQTRLSNGNVYSYYNYLVYGNVVGNDGRDGSYFGLSIRFDSYCKDFMSVYKVLDFVFCSIVVNHILKTQTGNYKYAVSDFAKVPDVMKSINNRTLELIQSVLTGDSFCSLNGFNTKSSQQPFVNLYETTSREVETLAKQYGKIAISPYYQTSSERTLVQQCEERLEAAKQQCEVRIKENVTAAESRIKQNQKELSSLQKENSSLTVQVAEQKKDIEKLKAKIHELDLTKESIAIIAEIKEPVMKLASTSGYKHHPDSAKGSKGRAGSSIRFILPWINTILGVIIIVMLTSPSEKKNVGQNDDLSELNDTINWLRVENEELKNQLRTIDGSEGNTTTGVVGSTFATGVYDNTKISASVDVKGYNEKNGVYLEKGKTYEASIRTSNNASDHKWKITGGSITGSDNCKTVSFIPTSEADVTLVYTNSNNENVERKLKVKKP